MDNKLARRERAALVASQAQTSSKISVLHAKVEEASRARFSQGNSPDKLVMKCKRCMAATENGKWKMALKDAGNGCSARAIEQSNKESQGCTKISSSYENLVPAVLGYRGEEDDGGLLETVVSDGEGQEEEEEEEWCYSGETGLEMEPEAEVVEEEEVQANKLVVKIDDNCSFVEKEDCSTGEGDRLKDFSELRPAASSMLRQERWAQSPTLSLSAEEIAAGFGGGIEGFKRRSAFTASGVVLESCRKGVGKLVSSNEIDCQSIHEPGGESKADDWMRDRLSSGSRPDRTCGKAWLPVGLSGQAADGAAAIEIQTELAKSPKAEFRAEHGPTWQNGWPGRLLGILSPRSSKESDVEVAGKQPVLSHRLPVLPRIQTPSPRMSLTPRGSPGHKAAIFDDQESGVGLASMEHSARSVISDASAGADWT